MTSEFIEEPARRTPVVDRCDVVVVGGGPAGLAAAVAAARNGARVTLLERYSHLGGLASGGQVLVLDDMCDGAEVVVRGICQEVIDRMDRMGLAVYPPPEDRQPSREMWRKWSRWGVYDYYSRDRPQPITYAVAFDPEAWKRASEDLVAETGVRLRLHSWFSAPVVSDGRAQGVICDTKEGRQAILGDVVIDATGDLDVAVRAGADFVGGTYMLTTVFRLGDVDTAAAERFEFEAHEEFTRLDRAARKILGGSWARWWLKTPLPGVVWCNCPTPHRIRWRQGGRTDRCRPRGAPAYRRRDRVRKGPSTGLRALPARRRGAADRSTPDAYAPGRVRRDPRRRCQPRPLRRQHRARA